MMKKKYDFALKKIVYINAADEELSVADDDSGSNDGDIVLRRIPCGPPPHVDRWTCLNENCGTTVYAYGEINAERCDLCMWPRYIKCYPQPIRKIGKNGKNSKKRLAVQTAGNASISSVATPPLLQIAQILRENATTNANAAASDAKAEEKAEAKAEATDDGANLSELEKKNVDAKDVEAGTAEDAEAGTAGEAGAAAEKAAETTEKIVDAAQNPESKAASKALRQQQRKFWFSPSLIADSIIQLLWKGEKDTGNQLGAYFNENGTEKGTENVVGL